MLTDASRVLHNALDGKVYLKSVNVIVPSSWRESKCDSGAGGSALSISLPKGDRPYRRPDVWVTGPHPIHGETPYTQQTKSCGQPGEFISFPFQYLSGRGGGANLTEEAPKLFAREWAKLRYGVFEESGYGHDQFYPGHFFHGGRAVPTETTNAPLRGVWVNGANMPGCDPSKEDCEFRPAGDNSGATCSLGGSLYDQLSNVTRFCTGKDLSGQPMSPSKHNVLCEGRAAADVILSHQDFRRINPKRSRSRVAEPEISVFREPTPQYVLVMETSRSMAANEQWKWINKAAQKFIRYDLPVNSKLAIVTFNNKSKVEHPMVEVTGNDARARLADTIPDKYHLSRSDKRCVLCALQKVVHEVLAPETLAGTHLVLLTRGSRDTLTTTTDEQIISNYVRDYNLRVSTVVLPESAEAASDPFLSFYDDISLSMGGSAYVVNGHDSVMDLYMGINSAFADILRSDARYPTETPVEVHRRDFSAASSKLVTTGSFLIDSTLGRDTLFGIYVEDEEEHRIRSITFADGKGKKYGPYKRMSSTFDLVNFKTINFPSEQAPPFHAVSRISGNYAHMQPVRSLNHSEGNPRSSTIATTFSSLRNYQS